MPGALWKVVSRSGSDVFQNQVGKVWCNSSGGEDL